MTVIAAGEATSFDGVVEAVRQTVLASQVAGSVVALDARAGSRVKAGQVLVRLDARAAEQQAGAAAAQVQAARATQEAATRELERQRQLFQKSYISQAALDRAEAQFKTAQAEAAAQLASAGAALTQSGFYSIKAPYDGIVADVAVVLGDMAMPGRPLLTLYDPAALRVTAAVPQSAARASAPAMRFRSRCPARLPAAWHRCAGICSLPPTRRPTRSSCASICRPASRRFRECSPAPGFPAAPPHRHASRFRRRPSSGAPS